MLYERRQYMQQNLPELLDNSTDGMAIARDFPADEQGEVIDDESIDIDSRWTPWVVISGGLGLLLSVYRRDSTQSFQIQIGAPEQIYDISLHVDRNCAARDFFEQIYKTHQEQIIISDATQSFRLYTDGIEISSTPFHRSFDSGPGDGPSSSRIPSQILCTIVQSEDRLSLIIRTTEEHHQTRARFLSQLAHVTKQLLIVSMEERKLREVDLICDLDRRDIQRWNQQPPSTVESTIHALFTRKVLHNSDSPAVESWDGTLTYLELDNLSSRLSSHLLEAGVSPGDCIPLCFEKSLWIVVAMLGVLKSGCSFLLMDVSHPTSRLQTLSKEAKAAMILSSSAQRQRAVTMAAQVLVVSNSSLHAMTGSVPCGIDVSPFAVAAVVFTSGTTGTPKGIQIEHYSICSSLLALAKLAGVNNRTRCFQFSSYAFDAGFGEILMTLISGGCICIPSEEDRLNNLAKSICAFNADTVILTPTVVRLLSPSDVPCLTALISGGERVTQDIVDLWGGVLNLVIVYGPAETTVASVAKKALPPVDSATRVGFPLNSRVWISLLDDPNKLAPVGVVGEIVVEGPGIARSYINNNLDSTNLFGDATPWMNDWDVSLESMGRYYRTGDMGNFADDGELIFIGRRDRQVKLRGQRIELEDIEFKLQSQNRLLGARIILEVLNIHNSDNLIAFYYAPELKEVPEHTMDSTSARMPKEMELEVERLRRNISEELPAYMWPVAWFHLQDVPLSPTGKLDRRVLVRLGMDHCSNLKIDAEDDYGLSPTESILARLWRQVLEFATLILKSDAHFFRMGGDSLCSMKLVTLANSEGYHLSMEKVFRNPTLCGMAKAMQDASSTPLSVVSASSLHPQKMSREVCSLLKDYGIHEDQVASILPCTALQEGLFSLSLASPSLYFSQFVFEFSTIADIEHFKASCISAIEAYPILRTAIVPSSSSLVQVVLADGPKLIEVHQDLASFLSSDKSASFDPGQPLMRFHHVLDAASNQSHLVWTLHHAIYDGWSLEYIVEHIRRKYYHLRRDVQPLGGFEEFVQFCEGLDRERSETFWNSQLRLAPTPSFPDLPKSGHLAADNTSLRYAIAAPAADTLGVTTTILARATWALLLSEYEGSEDIVFGNSLHGRNALPDHLQDVVGPTVTTLPIRVKIDRTQTVLGFLDDLQAQFSAMIPYEQFGLSRILAISQDIRNAASFRTLLIVQVSNTKTLREQGLRLEEVERSLHEFPLVLTLVPEGPKIEIIATFDSAVMATAQVRRILRQFEQTFHGICATSTSMDTKLGDLDLASEADKSTMYCWNARHHQAFEVCVHDLINEQVKRSPESTAIHSHRSDLSYAALDELSDKIAGEIERLEVKPGSVIGVLFEKSPWAIVSILAIIKAGSAFAPLSPKSPMKRLEDVSREADIRLVLCSQTQKDYFSNPPWQALVITFDTLSSFQSGGKILNRVTTPDSWLYVLSTSGTTGTPKVFAVQHKSFATGAIARASLIRRDSESRVLQFAPYVFDPSVEDILTTLMFGGCICVPSDEDIMGDISAFMKAARVNFANITPSVAHTLRQDELPDLRVLLLSGEAPDQSLIDKWNGKVQLMNGYGPSECSVKCSINCHLSRNDPRNIGHSVGSSLWVVRPENHNCLTPLGAVGELIIESPNLARGYLNGASTTEAKFVAGPGWLREFRDGVDTRIYKTGDLVRYVEDGSITYIGRADMQLKLHGQRLEGEEVRQRIQECLEDEQIQVLVDVARFHGQDTDMLIAYLARVAPHRLPTVATDSVLQQHLITLRESMTSQLGSVLPKYMIPSVFLAVTNIPVTANGKGNVDRRALRARTLQQRLEPQLLHSCDNAVQEPASEREKIQHRLWRKLLGLDGKQFGANAHFFDFGGSSLMAIKLAAAVRENGYTLSAQQIFKNPKLSAMAAEMTPLTQTKTSGPAKFSLLGKIGRSVDELQKCLAIYNIKEQDIDDAYPCTRMQTIHTREEMVAPGGNTFRHIVPLPAEIDLARLEGAIEEIIRMNALLRTRFIHLSSDLIQIVLNDGSVYPKVEFTTPAGFEDQTMSWGLGQPQSRFCIIDGGDSHSRYLAWSCTHAMFDPWTRKLLLQDIDHVYHYNDIAPTRPQYKSFVEYVYDLNPREVRTILANELENIEFFKYFTFDGTRIPQVTHRLSLGINFPMRLSGGLSYSTVMLTILAIVAGHVEGHEHFLFNIMFGGRDAEFTGVDSLIGPTITTAPLATGVKNASTVRSNVEIMQGYVDAAAGVKHSVELGAKLQQLLASTPLVIVNPPDDYEETPTKHLGLMRSRAEIRPSADAMVLNFCLHTGNAGVDLLMEIDPFFFPVEKGICYLGHIEQALIHIFSPRGMDTIIAEMELGTGIPTKSVSISTDQSWGTKDVGGSAASNSGDSVGA